MPALTSLWLGRNKIGALNGLDAVPNLQQLGLQSNRLTTLGSGLAAVVGLRELYVSHNGLTSLEGIGHLVRWTVFFLCVRVMVEGRLLIYRLPNSSFTRPPLVSSLVLSVSYRSWSDYSQVLSRPLLFVYCMVLPAAHTVFLAVPGFIPIDTITHP